SVAINGSATQFKRSDVTGVNMRLAGGNNSVSISSDLPATVIAGSGNDTIVTGAGDDSVRAGDGANTITTADGNDTATAGDGADTFFTGSGDDSITAQDGDNIIDCGDGNDHVDSTTATIASPAAMETSLSNLGLAPRQFRSASATAAYTTANLAVLTK